MISEERKEAIEYLKKYKELDKQLFQIAPFNSVSHNVLVKSLRHWDTAIQALEQEPCNDVAAFKENERKFEEIMVEYPPAELCTYPEYRGKPYFSIKYEENGEHIIGFGTYKPEVLSRYLREYFIAPAIVEKSEPQERSE